MCDADRAVLLTKRLEEIKENWNELVVGAEDIGSFDVIISRVSYDVMMELLSQDVGENEN